MRSQEKTQSQFEFTDQTVILWFFFLKEQATQLYKYDATTVLFDKTVLEKLYKQQPHNETLIQQTQSVQASSLPQLSTVKPTFSWNFTSSQSLLSHPS